VHNVSHFPASFVGAFLASDVPVIMTVHDYSLLCPNSWCVLPDGTQCEGGAGQKCFEHGCESNYPYDPPVVAATAIRARFLRRCVARFISPSTPLADLCQEAGFDPVQVLPYFAEPATLTHALDPAEQDPHRILFLGRLEREKGVTYLIQAMPRILASDPEARLSIVGEGTQSETLRQQALELGIQDQVEFHGKVPHTEVQRLLGRARVNVLPSVWSENSPVTCYESFSVGLPMVASHLGGLPELVREGVTGLLARPRDPVDLADKILRILLSDELHAKLSDAARLELQRYDPDAHLEQMDALYAGASKASVGQHEAQLDKDLTAITEYLVRDVTASEKIIARARGGKIRRIMNRSLDVMFRVTS